MEIKEKKLQSGTTWRFVNEYENSRNGFNHKTTAFRGAYEYGTYKVHYINRTWEMYTYQSSMSNAVSTIYEEELNYYINNYKENNNIDRFKKGQKDQVIAEFNETELGKELLELKDCIRDREFDRTSL